MAKSQQSIAPFLKKNTNDADASKVMPYEKGSKKYETLKMKLTELLACTSITQNAAQSAEFKAYITECDARAAATIPSRKTATKWVMNYATECTRKIVLLVKTAGKSNVCLDIWSQPGLSYSYLGITIHIFDSASKKFLALGLACTALAQPHTGTRIREALESTLETWGLSDTNVLRYITDQGSNVINGLKTYQFHHTFVREELDCPETEESELDSESEESNIPETEPQVESDLSDTEEEDSDDVSNDSNDETNDRLESTTVDQSSFVESNQWLEHVYLPKRLSCIAHIFNSACRTVHCCEYVR